MAIRFENLKREYEMTPVPADRVGERIAPYIMPDEKCLMAFQNNEDQLVFTTHRLISIDTQPGIRRIFTSIAYGRFWSFLTQTNNYKTDTQGSTLILFLAGAQLQLNIRGQIDLGWLCRFLAQKIV